MIRVKIDKADGFLIVQKEETDLFEQAAAICNPNKDSLDIHLFEEKQSLN